MSGAPASAEFIYDALRKVAVARGTDGAGQAWTLEFRARHDDDSMTVVVREPGGKERTLTLTDEDFVFGDDRVSLRAGAGQPAHDAAALHEEAPWIHARQHPHARHPGALPAVSRCLASYTDGRFVRREGIPTAVYGPRVRRMGGPDEYVEQHEVLQVARVHLAAVLDYLGAR
jgi:acetylornithine deacetylase/succinyl-diaminopimelate desuccinylase-like protein